MKSKKGGSFNQLHQTPSDAVVEPDVLPYLSEWGGLPLSLNLTEYHLLLLYPDRVRCLSRLSGNLVQDLFLPQQLLKSSASASASGSSAAVAGAPGGGGLVRAGSGSGGSAVGLARDEATGTVWVWGGAGASSGGGGGGGVWQVQVGDEGRDVWLLHLEQGLKKGNPAKFEASLRHAHSPQQRAAVLAKQVNGDDVDDDDERESRGGGVTSAHFTTSAQTQVTTSTHPHPVDALHPATAACHHQNKSATNHHQ